VRLRAAPGTDQGVLIENLGRDTVVQALGDQRVQATGYEWLHVRAGNQDGWVASQYLLRVEAAVSPQVLSPTELYDLVRRHGARPSLDRIMVAAALLESGGDTHARGDNGKSYGLWQLHQDGSGRGMSIEERCDPNLACDRMMPEFNHWFDEWSAEGRQATDLAVRTYLCAERPFQYRNPDGSINVDGAAGSAYLSRWSSLTS
jgi:hypothetical protein